MKKHRKWMAISGYFKEVPITQEQIDYIKTMQEKHENLLILIKKENHKNNPPFKPEEKAKSIWKAFPELTKIGKIIVSTIPDIVDVIETEF